MSDADKGDGRPIAKPRDTSTPDADVRNDAVEQSHHVEETEYREGRSVAISTPFYDVQAWGDPGDSFDAVAEKAKNAADRAKADVEDLDDRIDSDGGQYQ